MEREIMMLLDKCREEVMQWSKEHLHEGLIVSVFGEGLPSDRTKLTSF